MLLAGPGKCADAPGPLETRLVQSHAPPPPDLSKAALARTDCILESLWVMLRHWAWEGAAVPSQCLSAKFIHPPGSPCCVDWRYSTTHTHTSCSLEINASRFLL